MERGPSECISRWRAILGHPRAAIPTLIANHFSPWPRRLLPIHFGGDGAPSSDCSSGGSLLLFLHLYPRVGENMDAARREVGENISLAHLLLSLPIYLPISTPALRGKRALKHLDASRETSNRSFCSLFFSLLCRSTRLDRS